MQRSKAQVTAQELMAACSSAVRHEAQASLPHRLLQLLLQLYRSSQPHAVKGCLVPQTLVLISLLHVVVTTVRYDLDVTKNAPNQDNVEAGTRVASVEEMMSLHEGPHHRPWTTEETMHAVMTGEAAMTAAAEMEDTGADHVSRNKAVDRCQMHRDRSMVAHRKYPHHHHRVHLPDLHQSGSVALHATTPHLSTTGVVAEVANSGLEEAADVKTTGAEAGDPAVRTT